MKTIKTKLSNLFKLYNVNEVETPFDLQLEEIFIESPDGDYVKVNHLVRKETEMVRLHIESMSEPFECAIGHLILTPNGFKRVDETNEVLLCTGKIAKINIKENLGVGPAFDVSLDNPHAYKTPNGLIHHNTFTAIYKALEECLDKSNPFRKIIIVRSSVQARDMGALPGDVDEKMAAFKQPYVQICETLFGRKDAWSRLEEQGYVEFISTAFIRGMSFDNAIVIVDEMQNMTWEELSTVMTRVGYMSKIIFCGDYRQCDINKKKTDMSGIAKFLDIATLMDCFTRIEFTVDDICRSSLVKDFIIATIKYDDQH